MVLGTSGFVPARLARREIVTPNLGIFEFNVGDAFPDGFIPGQSVGLVVDSYRVGEPIKPRMLSVASDPRSLVEDGKLEFFVRFVEGGGTGKSGKGLMTAELFEPSDDEIYDEGRLKFYVLPKIAGKLYLAQDDTRNVIDVSTGTGLATAISKLRTLAIEADRNGGASSTLMDHYFVIWGTADCGDTKAYGDEFGRYKQDFGLRFIPVQSGDKCNPGEQMNHVTDVFFERTPGWKRISRYLSKEEIDEGFANGYKTILSPLERNNLERQMDPRKDVLVYTGRPDVLELLQEIGRHRGFESKVSGDTPKGFYFEKYWKDSKKSFVT